ncbi:MAG: hypothetical protein GY749_24220 [Desulfobacteraceae bacterium]|nr:hypothetical protein [Desulfobacteraceae bacterium]
MVLSKYGCPLSPLMGAIYLKPLDDALENLDVFYARYMDDWVVLANSRWKLKKAVKLGNQVLNNLKVEKHPFKTFIGRVDHGFDFLGYRLTPGSGEGVEIAWRTVSNLPVHRPCPEANTSTPVSKRKPMPLGHFHCFRYLLTSDGEMPYYG